jgi:hypothetical protein
VYYFTCAPYCAPRRRVSSEGAGSLKFESAKDVGQALRMARGRFPQAENPKIKVI